MEHSIHHTTSAPFTPAQNGAIERDNRTVFESARSMQVARRVQHNLWGEAVQTAVYLLNRSTNIHSDKTPFEHVFGRRPKVGHLRIFGSRVLVKLQEKKRTGYQKKLDDRACLMIMVGYEREYTYRLFNPEKQTVIISREVEFDESKPATPAASSQPADK